MDVMEIHSILFFFLKGDIVMFEKFTKKVVKDITKTAKVEITKSVDEQMPIIIGAIAMCVALLSIVDNKGKITKKPDVSTITINNYYYNK
jgi:hypothetical protein